MPYIGASDGLGQDPDYQRHLVPDEREFIDVPKLKFLMTDEGVPLLSPAMVKVDSYFKLTQIVRRRQSVTSNVFRKAWSVDGPRQ